LFRILYFENFGNYVMDILLVDDSKLNQFLVRRLIKEVDNSIHVDTASSSAQAISFIKSKEYDLMILDGDLNETLTGVDIARYVWLQKYDAKIVAYSSSATMQTQFQIVFKQFDKPYASWPKELTPAIISKTLNEWFDLRPQNLPVFLTLNQHNYITKRG
jgi:CheY-like chemotaxis protein